MVQPSASSSSLSSKKGQGRKAAKSDASQGGASGAPGTTSSSTSNTSNNNKAAGDTDDENLPTSHLIRPTPDAILADEADPDTLLGNESDSDGGGGGGGGASRRTSTVLRGSNKAAAAAPSLSGPTRSSSLAVDGAAVSPTTSPDSKADYRKSRQIFDAMDPAGTDVAAGSSSIASKGIFARSSGGSDQNGHAATGDDPQERGAESERAGELRNQVTSLNNKLVSSFMRIGDLEDDVLQMQEQISTYRSKITSLEKERGEHLAALNTGLLVEKEHVSTEMQKMMERLVQETAAKGKAVDEREKIEAELDELSSSLFSEANKMVAQEKLARARAEEKSRSMEERLKDTEEIMEHQQKRLVELQGALESAEQQAGNEKDGAPEGGESKALRGPRISMGPAPSASLGAHNIRQLEPLGSGQLRLDVIPYVELRNFLNHLRRLRLQLAPFYSFPLTGPTPGDENASMPGTPILQRTGSPVPNQASFPPSGSNFSFISQGFGGGNNSNQASSSPFLAAGVPRHKDFPTLPANVEQLVHLPSQMSSLGFLKRINEEDAEPCLRLDFAPGLNWLSRRQMQTAILEGNLMIEPIFGGGIYDEEEVRARATGSAPAACTMCGKAVVNVPLPGGGTASDVSTWASAASSFQASVGGFASSLPGREATASPPLGGGFFSSSSSNSTSSTAKDSATTNTSSGTGRSKSSIFSTLRSISSGSGRSSLGIATKDSTAAEVAAQQAQQQQAQQVSTTMARHPDDPFAGRLIPIPTHIFRISESSTARYLLCPDYCLQRLRATCDLWGYIRALERAVVLEGKFAFDEEQQRMQEEAAAAATPEGKISEAVEEQKPSAEAAAAIEQEPDLESDQNATEDSKVDEASNDSSAAIEKKMSSESVAKSSGKGNADEDAADHETESDAQSMHSAADSEAEAQGSASEADESGVAAEEIKSEPDDDEEADAERTVESTEQSAEIAQTPADEVDETAEANTTEASQKTEEAAAGSSAPPSLSSQERPKSVPPALPPRGQTPRTQSESTRPTSAHAAAGTPIVPAVPLGPEPRRLLSAVDPEKPSWEEKVWLEVNRLRADLWAARVGVVHPDGA